MLLAVFRKAGLAICLCLCAILIDQSVLSYKLAKHCCQLSIVSSSHSHAVDINGQATDKWIPGTVHFFENRNWLKKVHSGSGTYQITFKNMLRQKHLVMVKVKRSELCSVQNVRASERQLWRQRFVTENHSRAILRLFQSSTTLNQELLFLTLPSTGRHESLYSLKCFLPLIVNNVQTCIPGPWGYVQAYLPSHSICLLPVLMSGYFWSVPGSWWVKSPKIPFQTCVHLKLQASNKLSQLSTLLRFNRYCMSDSAWWKCVFHLVVVFLISPRHLLWPLC